MEIIKHKKIFLLFILFLALITTLVILFLLKKPENVAVEKPGIQITQPWKLEGIIPCFILASENGITYLFSMDHGYIALESDIEYEKGAYYVTVGDNKISHAEKTTDYFYTSGIVKDRNRLLLGFHLNIEYEVLEREHEPSENRRVFAFYYDKGIQVEEVSLDSSAPIGIVISFGDVAGSHIAYESIQRLQDEGLLNGSGDNRFYPDEPILNEDLDRILHLYDRDLIVEFKNTSKSELIDGLCNYLELEREGLTEKIFTDNLDDHIKRSEAVYIIEYLFREHRNKSFKQVLDAEIDNGQLHIQDQSTGFNTRTVITVCDYQGRIIRTKKKGSNWYADTNGETDYVIYAVTVDANDQSYEDIYKTGQNNYVTPEEFSKNRLKPSRTIESYQYYRKDSVNGKYRPVENDIENGEYLKIIDSFYPHLKKSVSYVIYDASKERTDTYKTQPKYKVENFTTDIPEFKKPIIAELTLPDKFLIDETGYAKINFNEVDIVRDLDLLNAYIYFENKKIKIESFPVSTPKEGYYIITLDGYRSYRTKVVKEREKADFYTARKYSAVDTDGNGKPYTKEVIEQTNVFAVDEPIYFAGQTADMERFAYFDSNSKYISQLSPITSFSEPGEYYIDYQVIDNGTLTESYFKMDTHSEDIGKTILPPELQDPVVVRNEIKATQIIPHEFVVMPFTETDKTFVINGNSAKLPLENVSWAVVVDTQGNIDGAKGIVTKDMEYISLVSDEYITYVLYKQQNKIKRAKIVVKGEEIPLELALNDSLTETGKEKYKIDFKELLKNDIGAAEIEWVGSPLYGSVIMEDGFVVYTPAAEFTGIDIFYYKTPKSNIAQVKVNITGRKAESGTRELYMNMPINRTVMSFDIQANKILSVVSKEAKASIVQGNFDQQVQIEKESNGFSIGDTIQVECTLENKQKVVLNIEICEPDKGYIKVKNKPQAVISQNDDGSLYDESVGDIVEWIWKVKGKEKRFSSRQEGYTWVNSEFNDEDDIMLQVKDADGLTSDWVTWG